MHTFLKSKGNNSWAANTDDDLKVNFAKKIESENIEQKIAALFSKDELDQSEVDKATKDLEMKYESANEDVTSDTAITEIEREEIEE